MDEIWKGGFFTAPFLHVGSWRRIMFPETGRNIPFTIENYAFVDRFGRETVSWIRTFESRRQRRKQVHDVLANERFAAGDADLGDPAANESASDALEFLQ